jgi:hypothetical protein
MVDLFYSWLVIGGLMALLKNQQYFIGCDYYKIFDFKRRTDM